MRKRPLSQMADVTVAICMDMNRLVGLIELFKGGGDLFYTFDWPARIESMQFDHNLRELIQNYAGRLLNYTPLMALNVHFEDQVIGVLVTILSD